MSMHELELFFSEFCKYSCISENVSSQKETTKYQGNLLELLVVIILKKAVPVIWNLNGTRPL